MIKRSWYLYILIAILVFLLSITAFGADPKVYDEAGLFSQEELRQLETKAVELGEALKLDLVIVTIEDNQGKTSRDFADDFYDYGGFGYGVEADGVLLLINMADREAYISTTGIAIKYLTDARIEAILDDIFEHLPDGRYADGAMAFLRGVEYYTKAGVQSNQYTYNEDTKSVVEEKQEAAEASTPRIYDEAGLFSQEELNQLEAKVLELMGALQLDLVIVTIDDNQGKTSRDFADDFYDYGDFGYGADADGALLLINMEDREVYISTTGIAIKYLTDARIEAILDKIFEHLADERYADGAMTFLEDVKNYTDISLPNQQDIYEEAIEKEAENEPTLGERLWFNFVLSVGVAGMVIISMVAKNKGVRGSTADTYLQVGSFNIFNRYDHHVNTIQTYKVIKKNPPPTSDSDDNRRSSSSSGRSTVHTASSGTTHGGGGRSFFSSSSTSSSKSSSGGGRSFSSGSTSSSKSGSSASSRSHGGGGRKF